jgi:hypothetical protein
MKGNPSTLKYFTLILLTLAISGTLLGGCARVYYGTFRYEAHCADADPRQPERGSVCVVERTK